MEAFEEDRVLNDTSPLMKSDKEVLTRGFLRRFPPNRPWVLRCASQLMLDFEVTVMDLWEDVLTTMLRLGMETMEQVHFSKQDDRRSPALRQDLDFILRHAVRLLHATVDVMSSNRWVKPALAAMDPAQKVV
ncbi:hypothetical protein PC128_g16618 [Phytophthora cactorum]|nr:hypothetical protein PC128_g16618 [Phytophthora cactorum]